jgi:hypothetical protein
MNAPVGIPHLHPVFGHVPSLNVAHGTQRRDDLKRESLMLARDETGASTIHLAEKGAGTEVAVLKPAERSALIVSSLGLTL